MATLKVTNIKNESFAGDQLYLKSNGYLGIGTTNPGEELEVSADAPSIQLLSTNASGRKYGFQSMNDGKFGIYDGTAGANRIVLASDGKVGIGVTSPTTHLHVNSGSTNTVALFESTDTETTIQLKDTTGSSYIKARNDFRFDNSTGELVRIESGGDVLIGLTSSPSGNGTNLWVSDGTVARLGIEKTGTGACKTTIGAGSDRAFNIYNETADHEIIKGETDGDVKITTGNLIIGTAGKGIDFSAQTASSATGATTSDETLDHYETGTWTPTDGSGASLTFTNVNAWYVKVGDLVTMGARFAYPTTTNTNQNKIGGFPFSPGTNVFSVGGLMVGTVQNPMGNQGSWSGMDQTGRLRTENASIPYNDDLSGQTVYLSYIFKTD
jgi:hypothetical protein